MRQKTEKDEATFINDFANACLESPQSGALEMTRQMLDFAMIHEISLTQAFASLANFVSTYRIDSLSNEDALTLYKKMKQATHMTWDLLPKKL
jgi:hypothetical protein